MIAVQAGIIETRPEYSGRLALWARVERLVIFKPHRVASESLDFNVSRWLYVNARPLPHWSQHQNFPFCEGIIRFFYQSRAKYRRSRSVFCPGSGIMCSS
ncbi:hypothetical protein Dda3937_04449 [Dickeya dadantii 3937]|uniref:Uncharacterized protein n=1 Tax=Dickeya dadantii (strain 3937) TaxID=198628 RepID=E0SI76_DICD3|nr:hypothetical protein Dda3937_04449 [Dickeya dadantii 3937]